MIRKPLLVVNFKAYPTSHGQKALEMAKAAFHVSNQVETEIILVPPHTEIYRISQVYSQTYGQPPDISGQGAYTGRVSLEMIVSAGAKGVLINHSEKKIPYNMLVQMISNAKRYGLKTIVCAETPVEAKAIALAEPDYIAIEPPELIGTGIPVSKAKPEIITQSIDAVSKINPSIPVLAGAGITNGDDAYTAIQLGAAGVLVASAVMKHKEPQSKLNELATALSSSWAKKTPIQ
ncbi:MAG: triose-phosphate isomerase [Desulfurococcales archaeon]|nr:triose-phosphate isomerase [Desulfurococcales archaeon]